MIRKRMTVQFIYKVDVKRLADSKNGNEDIIVNVHLNLPTLNSYSSSIDSVDLKCL